MRIVLQQGLDRVGEELLGLARTAEESIGDATDGLLESDTAAIDRALRAKARAHELRQDIERGAVRLLATQQPVATDLRVVVAALHAATDLERMTDLATHLAEIAQRRDPERAVPEVAREVVSAMADVARQLSSDLVSALQTGDVAAARRLDKDDDRMDELHRQLFAVQQSPQWQAPVPATVDCVLVGRFYERFADHAVSVGEQLIYQVTGEAPSTSPG